MTDKLWHERRVGELGRVVTGTTPPSSRPECFAEGDGYPFITPGDLWGGRKADSPARFLSEEGATLLRTRLIPPGSVAVSCIGWQMGRSVMTSRPSFTNQQLNAIVPYQDVCGEFLYYAFCARQEELLSLGSATGVRTPIVNKSAFEALTLLVPSLNLQRRIAAILSAYDDLIENNLRRIKILEEMAQSLYQEWFVDFRFPGHECVKMVDSPLGMNPEGWNLSEVRRLIKRLPKGRVYQQAELGETAAVPVVDQSSSEIGGFHDNEADLDASASSPVVAFGDHTCRMRIMTQPFSVGPNVVPFRAESLPTTYCYFVVRGLVETREYKRHWNDLAKKMVVVAPPNLAEKFAAEIEANLAVESLLQDSNRNLRQTRDLLLPKLISGELDVSDLDIDIGKDAA